MRRNGRGDRVLDMKQFGKAAWAGSALLALPLIVAGVLAETVLPASGSRLATLFLIYVVAVLGNQI